MAIWLFANLNPSNPSVTRMAAVAVLMAGWWITEAIPIPATAMVPIALFPLLGIMPGSETAGLYFNNVIFLFVGGFIFALAMRRWSLHRRVAMRIILVLGTGPRRLILGFMVATWFLSMWISNTATTMMMVPMALAIIVQFKETFGKSVGDKFISRYAVALLIGIAYAASIGGFATLIGTPPNLAFVRILQITFPGAPEISFLKWILFALPISMIFLAIAWLFLCRLFIPKETSFDAGADTFRREYKKLGKMGYEERLILILFGFLVFFWLFRSDIDLGALSIPGWSSLMTTPGFIDDGTVAISIALLLFLIPARSNSNTRLMNWETATQLPWGIVILFGGGFALAGGFKTSGLSVWLGSQLAALGGWPPLLIVAATCFLLTFLTELTSNTATTQMALPILGSISVAIGINPLLLMIPATLSASCAFMLPVATPPNAIVFGSGEVRIADMARAGILLNFLGIILITAAVYTIGAVIFEIDFSIVPTWATGR